MKTEEGGERYETIREIRWRVCVGDFKRVSSKSERDFVVVMRDGQIAEER